MKMLGSMLTSSAFAGALLFGGGASAQVFIGFDQVGNDVVATVTGTFDTSTATQTATSNGLGKYIYPSSAFFGLGSGTTVAFYRTTGAPSTFSNSNGLFPYTTSSGTTVGMNGIAGYFFLDPAYVSNSAISTTALFANTTLAAIGLDPATYNFSVGGNAVTLRIGQANAAVPEPATWALMLLGFGAAGFAMRRREQRILT